MIRRAVTVLSLAATLLFSGAIALAQTAGFVATVTADSADLRKNASDGAPRTDTVMKGAKLPAFGLSPDKKWVRVKAPNGETVWIGRADVKLAKADASSMASTGPSDSGNAVSKPTPAATPRKSGPGPGKSGPAKNSGPAAPKKYAHVRVPKTNVHLNPTKASPVMTVARKNDEFEVGGFSRDGMWVKVRTSDKRIGWVGKTDMKPGRAPDEMTPVEDDDEPIARPTRPPPRPKQSGGDTAVWADAGIVLINEVVTSNEGYGYDLSASGYGAGVRFERRLGGSLWIDGGYLGTANQRIPSPDTTASIFSTLHRIDVSGKYKFALQGDDDGASVSAIVGYQNYSFLVQPQNLSWFYSQIYNSGVIGLGGEYPVGNIRFSADGRYFVPVLAGQRYGSGGAGGDGQSNTSTGYSIGAGVRYDFFSGGALGVGYRGHFYETKFKGQGQRGPNDVTGVVVKDSFQAITLTYARGF